MSKIPFKISARTAGLIGRENIASPEGAIIELVKNSYDADATKCVIFFDFSTKDKCLYLIDNGEGMSDKVIKKHWMVIGTSNKLHSPFSKNKRIKSGAKGIGRFALDRLGESVCMTTKPRRGSTGFIWKANWKDFSDQATLDKVYADLERKKEFSIEKELKDLTREYPSLNQFLVGSKFTSGTIFKISGLHDDWDENAIEKLLKNLESLIPPKPNSEFDLILVSTFSEKNNGKIKSTFWDDYDYKLSAKFLKNNKIKITIYRREFVWKDIRPDVFKEKSPKDMSKKPYNLETLKKGEFTDIIEIADLWPGIDEKTRASIESIGPFDFDFYYLKRMAKDKNVFAYRNFDTRKRIDWLDRFGGIKVFRDGFRVRPYGEINSSSFDWLDLGIRVSRNTQGPAQKTGINWKVEPNQVYGVVSMSRITNPELKDTTNREGLVENKSFFALKDFLVKLINIVEKDRHYIMRPMRVIYEKEREIEKAIEEAKELAKIDENSQDLEKSTYAKAVKGFEEIIKEKDDEIRMLSSLASIGMTISTFTHELQEIRNFLVSYSKKLKHLIHLEINHKKFSSHKRITTNPFLLMDEIIQLITRLNNWLDFTNNSIKKDRRKATDLKLVTYFQEFKVRWKEMLNTRNVKLDLDKSLSQGKFKKAYPIDLDSIFNNLLLNSIDAFYRKDSTEIREVKIEAELEEKGISIYYQDTGPGLLKEIKDPNSIFEPFFTTKKRGDEEIGIGLGMWIVKTIIEQYNGYVEVLNTGPGFRIKIYFPNFQPK